MESESTASRTLPSPRGTRHTLRALAGCAAGLAIAALAVPRINAWIWPDAHATERAKILSDDSATSVDLSNTDLQPYSYSSVDRVMDLLKLDSWVNPTKRDFTPAEEQRVKQFVAIDGLLAFELDREFHRHLAILGESRISEGSFDGQVDVSLLSNEQASSLPQATKDWLRPIYFTQSGSMYTWVQLDLPTEAPELARLLRDGRAETEMARKRLRDFVLSLK